MPVDDLNQLKARASLEEAGLAGQIATNKVDN